MRPAGDLFVSDDALNQKKLAAVERVAAEAMRLGGHHPASSLSSCAAKAPP